MVKVQHQNLINMYYLYENSDSERPFESKQLIPMRKFYLTSLLIAVSTCLTLCTCETKNGTDQEPATDYSKIENWLSLPANNSKNVDIFYIYPTAWFKQDPAEPNFCAVDHPAMLLGSKNAFDRQATAFETVGNLYAPYYRQADAAYTLTLPPSERWAVIDSIPAKDVIAAFDYYIKNYNKDKPFILVGHSQGAQVLLILLNKYMTDHADVYARMVCAYVIGYPVTAEFMNASKHLAFAGGADDTGVIVSYNTQSPSVAPGANIVMAGDVGLVINPINWKRDETPASAKESLGSYLPLDEQGTFGLVPHFADARINLAKGVLECTSVDEDAMYQISGAMGLGVYHSFDIPFYYYNLRENAQNRVNRFLAK
jgi:pimeloyl-ACP methyl ester carboxylesterase